MKTFEQFKQVAWKFADKEGHGTEIWDFPVNECFIPHEDETKEQAENQRFISFLTAVQISAVFSELANKAAIALGACESPIEKMLLCALYAANDQLFFGDITPCRSDEEWNAPGSYGAEIRLRQQMPVNKYRVDFALAFLSEVPDWGKDDPAPRGTKLPGFKFIRNEIFIECDGHDFHERTKDQAKRDRVKDRFFQANGMRLLRFTGSEIWADPIKCARELVHIGMKSMPQESA